MNYKNSDSSNYYKSESAFNFGKKQYSGSKSKNIKEYGDEFDKNFENDQRYKLEPEFYFGLFKFKKDAFKFVDEHLIIFSNSSYLTYFDLVEEKFRFISANLNLNNYISRLFSLKHSNYIVFEIVDFKKPDTKKILFLNLSNNIGLENDSISLNLESNLIDLNINKNDTHFVLITQVKSKSYLSIWCLNKMIQLNQVNLAQSSTDLEVSFYPNDSKKILVIAENLVSSFLVDDNDLISKNWHFSLPTNYTCYKWLNLDEILLGFNSNKIVIFNVSIIQISKIFDVFSDLQNFNLLASNENDDEHMIYDHQQQVELKDEDINSFKELDVEYSINKFKIRQILIITNGFIFLYGLNKIGIYQLNTLNDYNLKHFCELTTYEENSTQSSGVGKQVSNEQITFMEVNNSENCLLCFTDWNSIYKLDLSNDSIYKKSILKLKLIKTFHYSKIMAIDTCYQKPLITSYAAEKIIKIWNYVDKNMLLNKKIEEIVHSISLHPTGIYLALSFLNKIVIYSIILNDLKYIFTFKINQCNFIKFSNGGHLLGAISFNTIKIFDIWTLNQNIEIKQRIGKIQHFMWFEDDQFIISCSNSGIISIWNSFTGQRLYEYIEKQVQFKQITFDYNQSKLFIFALDKLNSLRILSCKFNKEIIETISNNIEDIFLERIIDFKGFDISCLNTYRNNIFFGNDKGHLISFKYYFEKNETSNFQIANENFYQNSGISQLVISNSINNIYLVSGFDNGLLVLCNLSNKNQSFLMSSSASNNSLSSNINQEANFKFTQQTKNFEIFNDILITKNDIKKIISSDLNLKKFLIEQEDERNYQLRLKDMIHKEQTKTINYEAKLNLTCLRSLYKEMKQLYDDKLKKKLLRFDKLKFKLEKDLELIKENAEYELNKRFLVFSNLSDQFFNLNMTNNTILDGINRLNFHEQILFDIQKKDLETIEKNQTTEVEQRIRFKLDNLKQLTKFLINENDNLEIKEDEKMREMVELNRKTISDIKIEIQNLKFDTCFLNKKLSQAKEKFLVFKEKKMAFSENYVRENKNLGFKLDQMEKIKKVLKLRQKELDSQHKSNLELKKKFEYLNKLNNIQKYELEQLEASSAKLKATNDNLKNVIQSNEEKLSVIIQKRINFVKQMSEMTKFKTLPLTKLSKNNKNYKDTRIMRNKNHKFFKSFYDPCN